MQLAPYPSISLACSTSFSGLAMCAIIRKPTVSISSLRAKRMCCSDTSASVQCVATRMVCTPRPCAIFRWSTVPMPGSSRAETLACFISGMTALRYCSSLWAGKPVTVSDFDQRNAGGVQPAGDGLHLLERHQVALGVHAVAQRHVVHGDLLAFECHGVLLLTRPRVRGRARP